jgi:predicted Abi (CAAX) family protease
VHLSPAVGQYLSAMPQRPKPVSPPSAAVLLTRLRYRFKTALRTWPRRRAWQFALFLLLVYGLVYLPIGLSLSFLSWSPRLEFWTVLGVSIGSLLMPGLIEELIFRALLVPHPTEPLPPITRRLWIGASLILFFGYHLNPWAPRFFGQPVFLLGMGLLGLACTVSYLQSRSVWTAVLIHWFIVVSWLLLFGGLAKF